MIQPPLASHLVVGEVENVQLFLERILLSASSFADMLYTHKTENAKQKLGLNCGKAHFQALPPPSHGGGRGGQDRIFLIRKSRYLARDRSFSIWKEEKKISLTKYTSIKAA